MELKASGVYIMQASNGLVKIGKANNPHIRLQQLEQGANMFNRGERLTLKLIKFYPSSSETFAFALEGYLHQAFTDYNMGNTSREVFDVDVQEVVKIADIWSHAFSIAQTIAYQEILLKKAED